MSLRKRTVVGATVVFIFVLGITLLIVRYVLGSNFLQFEQQAQQRNVQQVTAILENEVDGLATITGSDWAYWDDTYQFAQDHNQEYINANITPFTFTSLKIDAIVYLDTQGRIFYQRAYDRQTEKDVPLSDGLNSRVLDGSLTGFPNGHDGKSGIISLPEGLAMVASYPILTTHETGPSRGALIMVRNLDEEQTELLSQLSVTLVTILPTDKDLPADFKAALSHLPTGASGPYIKALDSATIRSYKALDDINGRPVALLRVETPRYGFSEATLSMFTTVILLSGGAVLALAAMLIFINRRIISRVARLRTTLHAVATSGNTAERVLVTGNDEIAQLATDINNMLTSIQKHSEDERKLNENLAMEIKKRSEYTHELVHELKTPITPILSSSELLIDGLKGEPWTRLARNIYRGALDMNDRLNDLVDTARSEVGTLRLRNEPVDVMSILRGMAEEMAPLISSRQQNIILDLPASLPIIKGDDVRLRQVLRNLLSNATKYTPEHGTITLRAHAEDNRLVVDIADTGRGIAPDQLGRISSRMLRYHVEH